MSRLANMAITLPKNVTVTVAGDKAVIKGKTSVELLLHPGIVLAQEAGIIHVKKDEEAVTGAHQNKSVRTKNLRKLNVLAGTTWSLLKNALIGVSDGFKIKLELVGVGYRAQVQGHKINLTLGFSHPVVYELPKNVTAETPSQTEIVLSSFDNTVLGQTAAEIRSYRPPECYKGKGVKYAGEVIVLKETKKK